MIERKQYEHLIPTDRYRNSPLEPEQIFHFINPFCGRNGFLRMIQHAIHEIQNRISHSPLASPAAFFPADSPSTRITNGSLMTLLFGRGSSSRA